MSLELLGIHHLTAITARASENLRFYTDTLGMRLIKKPERPKWRPFVHITFERDIHHSWRHFIDLAYWNVELGE